MLDSSSSSLSSPCMDKETREKTFFSKKTGYQVFSPLKLVDTIEKGERGRNIEILIDNDMLAPPAPYIDTNQSINHLNDQKDENQSISTNKNHHLISMGPDNHPRSLSILRFNEENSKSAVVIMRQELDKMIAKLPEGDGKKLFEMEMEQFYRLFLRFINSGGEKKLNWNKINSPPNEKILSYDELSRPGLEEERILLGKCGVLKLNGGLGTTMGCVGPKSAIEVREDMTFLDLTVRQIEWLNQEKRVNIPFILMNSFNTDSETRKIIQKYGKHHLTIITFNQSRFPRIRKESLLPMPSDLADAKDCWYPPGHGDLFSSLDHSGLLDDMLDRGIEYLFVSNIDNLGATVDTSILKYMADSNAEFLMEVTDKTRADIKGGTLIDYDGQIRLLELAQVPSEHKNDFVSIKKFKIFNTNNIWINIRAIKKLLEKGSIDLDIIINQKITDNTGEQVIQLETAVGAAIKHFNNAYGINVPRSRFLPVKSCSDLFLIQSDLYSLCHGQIAPNPKRQFSLAVPLIKLGDHFKKVTDFLSRFAGPVHILELDHLTVTGDVTFGAGVTLKGTVIIVANHGCHIDIPAGAILENQVVSGNLRIMDH